MARIFVGLPVMGGFYSQMFGAVLRLMQENPGDHQFVFRTLHNESLISRGRNTLATKFLESDCDYFLSIDADIEFPVDAVDRLVRRDRDIVAAPYCSKAMPPVWALKFHRDRMPAYVEGLVSVQYVSTGFTLVKRRVFEKLKDRVQPYLNQGAQHHAFYLPFIHEVAPDQHEYLSEDWAFCQRAIDAGFEIHCDFDIRLVHWGLQGYAMSEINGRLPSNPMMPFAEGLDEMTSVVSSLAAASSAVPADQDYAALLQNMMSSFQEVQDLLGDLATGKVVEQPPQT